MWTFLFFLGCLTALVSAVFGVSAAATGHFGLSTIFLIVEILGGILLVWSVGKISFDE